MKNKRTIIFSILILLLLSVSFFQYIKNNRLVEDNMEIMKVIRDKNSEIDSMNRLNELFSARSKVDEYMIQLISSGKNYDSDSLARLLNDEIFLNTGDFKNNRLQADSSVKANIIITQSKINALSERLSESESGHKKLLAEFIHLSAERNQLTAQLNVQSDSIRTYLDSIRSYETSIGDIYDRHKDELKVLDLKRNGNSILYTGEKNDGMANGYGVGLWSTGGTYRGDWKDNLRDGRGVYKWKDGEMYDGDWKEDMRTGEGKYIWKDGHYYIGGWYENRREGTGTIYYPNGKVQYQGQWKNDKFVQPSKEDRFLE